jgi:hypothetical protein
MTLRKRAAYMIQMVVPVLAAASLQAQTPARAADVLVDVADGGTDIGAQVNKAILALPPMPLRTAGEAVQHCGVVRISPGKYAFATTIVKPNCVTIEGGGAQMVYRGKTTAIAEAGPRLDNYSAVSGGINNLWLQGPGTHLGVGMGDTIGLMIGGDPSGIAAPPDHGAYAQTNQNLHIEGFHTGILLGGYSSLNSEVGGQIANNYQGIWAPNNTVGAGEEFDLFGVLINNSYQTGILNDMGYEIKQFGGSIDYTGGVPGQPFYAGNKFALSGSNVTYEGHGVHFEQDAGPIINMAGNGNILTLFGGEVYESGKSAGSSAFVQVTGPNNAVVLDGVKLHAEHVMTELVDWRGTGTEGSLTLHGAIGNCAHTTPVAGNTKGIRTWDVAEGEIRFGANGMGTMQGGVSWTNGAGAPPAGACATGSLYSNRSGAGGQSLYVCEGAKWVAK